MPFLEWKSHLAKELAQLLSHSEITDSMVLADFTSPPKQEMGHLAFPCFRIGKILGKPAGKLAQELEAR
ncbi:hypothetical protein EBT16_05655, partial [bacterium]|nr:hypothetical protein [bacterium]